MSGGRQTENKTKMALSSPPYNATQCHYKLLIVFSGSKHQIATNCIQNIINFVIILRKFVQEFLQLDPRSRHLNDIMAINDCNQTFIN